MRQFLLLLLLVIAATTVVSAQDPSRFAEEVRRIQLRCDSIYDHNKRSIVFTGSSSIRLWQDLQQRFPSKNILNTGFGGSHMSDMFFYTNELILAYKPEKVFIYEGDNDLGQGQKPAAEILLDAEKMVSVIQRKLPDVSIFFITPKPSIKRWHLRDTYINYISELKKWAKSKKKVVVIDVWTPMLDTNGNLKTDLFIEDELHMNTKGYAIWTEVIRPYLR